MPRLAGWLRGAVPLAAAALFAAALASEAASPRSLEAVEEAAFEADDECRPGAASAGGCALNALQARGAAIQAAVAKDAAQVESRGPFSWLWHLFGFGRKKSQSPTEQAEETAPAANSTLPPAKEPPPAASTAPAPATSEKPPAAKAEPSWQPGGAKVSVRVLNNASNTVVLANCVANYTLLTGLAVDVQLELYEGFWVLPDGVPLDCRKGCADCFYLATEVASEGKGKARIDYGDGHMRVAPVGGGIELSVAGAGARRCTPGLCPKGWRQPLWLKSKGAALNVVVQGSLRGLESEADRVAGRRRWSRIVQRRTAIYHPGLRIHPRRRAAPQCAWCNQHGHGSCWWHCR